MINLPFNKWTLQFQNDEQDRLYEIAANKYRLQYFLIFLCFQLFLSTTFLIIFILEGQSIYVSISLGVLVIALGLGIFNIKKLEKHVRYLFLIMYLIVQSICLYMASIMETEELYLYGMSASASTTVSLLFSFHKVRMALFLLTPSVQLYVLNFYTVEHLKIITLIYTTSIFLGIFSHHYEYMNRLAFSLNLIIEKQREIVQQFVPSPLIAISLNQRTNQFELQYQNVESQKQFNIEDTKTMVEILRNTYVSTKGQNTTHPELQLNQNVLKSVDLTSRRGNKRLTLEEFAFHRIREMTDMKQDSDTNYSELDGIYFEQHQLKSKTLNIEMKKISYGINTLIIVLKEEKANQITTNDAEQIKFLKKIIKFISINLYASQQQVFKSIQQLGGQYEFDKVWNIKCLSLFVMNKFQNFIVFLNQNRTEKELINFQPVSFKHFIKNLEQYFSQMAIISDKKFNLHIDIPDLQLKVNTKYLSQILINLFEKSLELCDQIKSTIILSITQDMNLNPMNSIHDNYINNGSKQRKTVPGLQFTRQVEDSLDTLTCSEKQRLIRFEFSFKSSSLVELEPKAQFILNPMTSEEFLQNNNHDFNIEYSVTNFLLEKIGPYNKLYTQQNLCFSSQLQPEVYMSTEGILQPEEEAYLNIIYFYIYTDQTKLTQSFFKCAHPDSFLKD